ncbi:MAG: radical SAM protein [Theionarchaea archaeon]|nr:radical SAM protein [Theionarchaea archaeon]
MNRYAAVLEKKVLPHYIITRNTLIKADLTSGIKDLWAAHAQKEPGSTSFLKVKAEIAHRMLYHCEFCERRCGVKRPAEAGDCGVKEAKISHELVPSHPIFFGGCNFHCIYCQNWDISQAKGNGRWIPPRKLAKIIDKRNFQDIHFVGGDPIPNTHYILDVLTECKAEIPVFWNSNMYMTESVMNLLDGVVDAYIADFKYGNNECAEELSKVKNYFEIITRNHLLAEKNADLIIRHLVLPDHIECCTYPIMKWISKNLDNPVVNVSIHYRPEHNAMENSRINRYLTYEEQNKASEIAKEFGYRLD